MAKKAAVYFSDVTGSMVDKIRGQEPRTMIQKKPLFSWILHRYRGLQLLLFGLIAVTVFFRVVPLELQKRIINRAISLKKMDLLFLYCSFYLVAAYDQIAVFKDGKLVERGSYQQLMTAEGIFYKLKQGIVDLANATA